MIIPYQSTIPNELYEAAAKGRRSGGRNYLGMSEIGKPCSRALWYGFRGYTPIPIDGRVQLLFRLGDRIEEEIIHHLRLAGYQVEGQQEPFVDGWFRGHCDGIIHGITQRPHVLECKSANDKKFAQFKKNGVQATSPTYYGQGQCYMGYSGLERCLFVIYNKNTSEIYTERLYFMKHDFETLKVRAYSIIGANDPPPAIDNDFECQWCDQRITCQYPDEAIVSNQVCGTCYYLSFPAGSVRAFCMHPGHNFQINEWGIGCPDWIDRYVKEEVKTKKLDHAFFKPQEYT